MPEDPRLQPVRIASAKISLRNIDLPNELMVDELTLDGVELTLTPPPSEGKPGAVSSGESTFRAVLTEPNLNRTLIANMPPNLPFRNLRAEVFSGYIRITGQIVKIITMPVTLDVVPKVENGVRVTLDWREMRVGISLPGAVREAIENFVSRPFDLTRFPVPIWLDEIKCEPGRLVARGKLRVAWPPAASPVTPSAFAVTRAVADLPPSTTGAITASE